MKTAKIRSYWLILAGLILGVSLFLSVNRTQARYSTSAVWNTVVRYDGLTMASDCLADEPQIILLGQLPEAGREIPIHIAASRDTEVSLTWSCDEGAYLDVEAVCGVNDLNSGDGLTLSGDGETEIILILTPTESALTQPHGELTMDVEVRCGTLQGTFRVTFPEVEEPTEPTTEPTETTEPSSEPTEEPEVTEETTEPTEAPEVTTEPTDAPAETTENQELTTGGSSETVQADATSTVTSLTMETITSLEPDGLLPLTIRMTDGAEGFRLGVGAEKKTLWDTEWQLAEFPAYTRYRMDGATYLLYDGGYIEAAASAELFLLLDVSQLGLSSGQELTLIGTESHADGTEETAAVTTCADADLSALRAPLFLKGSFLAEGDLPEVELGFPGGWIAEDLSLSYRIQMLCPDSFGPAYRDVELNGGTLTAEYVRDESSGEHLLRLGMGEELPPAGTYRLMLTWNYQGHPFREDTVPLFVQYGTGTE